MFRYVMVCAALVFTIGMTGCAASASPTTTPSLTPTPQVGTIFHQFPEQIEAAQRYVIYLHGRIIEDEGTRPVSPEFGLYEYEETLEALAQAGLQVIAEVRPSNTDVEQYASRVVSQVNDLLNQGVPPEHITVMGFSKGGAIAIFTSTRLQHETVNVVLLAICSEEWAYQAPDIALSGRVLSLYETSDEYGQSCQPLIDTSEHVSEFREIVLSTGKRHGTFYAADPLWLEPVIEWILAVP